MQEKLQRPERSWWVCRFTRGTARASRLAADGPSEISETQHHAPAALLEPADLTGPLHLHRFFSLLFKYHSAGHASVLQCP